MLPRIIELSELDNINYFYKTDSRRGWQRLLYDIFQRRELVHNAQIFHGSAKLASPIPFIIFLADTTPNLIQV